ncbi:MAG TPA: ankyrin repeat domain-containing protein [Allosphingosinicella sp.]|nr:ankyrin repeat domain-containing protein [Allosphingosinicella sp.]
MGDMGPTTIFLIGGVAAVLAAAVGGGMKAFGVEIPLLAKPRQQAFGLIVGVCLIALGLANDGWFSGPRGSPETNMAQANAAQADAPARNEAGAAGNAAAPAAIPAPGSSGEGPTGAALLAAAGSDDLEGVRRNLTPTTFTARAPQGMNALMIAADKCRMGIARYILGSGMIDRNAINARNEFGDTALDIARGTDSDLREQGVANRPRCAPLIPVLATYAH